MMPFEPQTMLAWVDAVGWTLLHFLWQGAVLGIGYAALRPICRTLAARYRLGMGVLAAMIACPILTLAWLAPAPAAAGAALALPDLAVSAEAVAGPAPGAGVEALLPWLVGAWFLGASLIGLRAFAHWRRLAWLVRNASIPLTDCTDVLLRLCRRFGISRRVRLLGSMAIDTPMLVGWLRPVILLPISMLSGFTPSQIELIIAHELGHVRRWDYLANLLQVVIETVLFYHPVVHWISRDVRDAREGCCDDLVLALADGSPVAYANALAELEQLRHDGGLAAPALAASGGVLLERIRRIVGAQSVLYDPLPRSGGWPIVLLVAAVGVLAALRLHTPQDLGLSLANAPARTVAALSGNPRLLEPAPAVPAVPLRTAIRPDVQVPAIVPVPREAVPAVAAAAEEPAPVAPVARPRIVVATAAPSVPRAGDIRERIAPMPALPAPAAADAPVPQMPVALLRVQPDYPLREKIHGVTGKVELQFGIASDGGVIDVKVVQSTPEHVFDRVAINALERWRFAAAGVAGHRYTQSFAFTLGTTPSANEPCREVIGSHICRHMAVEEESPP
jgi:bla regulator protein BlaR1